MSSPLQPTHLFPASADDGLASMRKLSPELRAYAAGSARGHVPMSLDRRAYAAPYESLTFTVVTRARRQLTVTLAAQPVFDLGLSTPVSRRLRRIIRHQGGERALLGLGRRTMEPVDLRRIDLQTLRHGIEMLRAASAESGVLPVFWRTVTSSGGRFALLCAEMRHEPRPGALMVEVVGGRDNAAPEAIAEAVSHFETAAQGVILHITPDIAAARRLKGVEVGCVAIDFAGVAHDNARDWIGAARLIETARLVSPKVLLLNLRPDRGLAAHAAGATHAVFAGMDAVSI